MKATTSHEICQKIWVSSDSVFQTCFRVRSCLRAQVFGLIFVCMSVTSICQAPARAQVPTRLKANSVPVASSVSGPALVLDKSKFQNAGPEANLKIPATTGTSADPEPTVVIVIGDSLSEGYGVERAQAFPDRAQEILRSRGHKVRIVNGGISGSVTADADRRLRWYLKTKPKILFLELGGNDALKGTPISVIKANLVKVIDLAQVNHLTVVLAGMQIYSSYGTYADDYAEMYRKIAKEKKVKLLPFLLKDVAMKAELNQSDMKHPNVKGHEIVAHTLADFLEPLL